jgi:hypothetical protein
MNFSELKDELYARGADYLEDDAASVARAERWLNQAYREILNLHAWPFLQASATGTADAGEVTVSDLRKIRFVTDTDDGDPGRKLTRVSLDELVADEDESFDLTRTGRPEFYYLDSDDTIKAYPVGGTIRVYYFKRVAPMSADADEPIFDEEYHPLIVDRAMIKVYIDSDNFEQAAALREEYNLGLRAMAEDYLLESREVKFIPVDPYDG